MLVLEVAAPEICAFYRPPDAGPNVVGYLARVYPGGSFLGIDYERLLALGTGSHEVLADERAKGSRGVEPPKQPVGERQLGELQWALFMYREGICTEGEVVFQALLAMTPGNVASAAACLTDEWQRRLQQFAADIPTFRRRGGVRSICSGEVMQVPDENLVAVHQWFGGRAEPLYGL